MNRTQQVALIRRTEAARDQQFAAAADLAASAEQRQLSTDEEGRIEVALTEAEQLDERARRIGTVTVRSEPRTYEADGRFSYFRDMLAARSDSAARSRLDRHATEARVDATVRERRANAAFDRALSDLGGTAENRTNPSTVPGQGGEFTPPAWLIDHAATAPASGRPIANLSTSIPLPPGVSSVNVPRVTTSPTATIQTADAAAVSNTDLVDATTKSTIVTITGAADVSQQVLDQTPNAAFDLMVLRSLMESGDAALETEIINGAGPGSGQLLGLLNVPGILAVTYTDASPTVPEFWAPASIAASKVATARKLPPTCFAMHPRRWFWIAGGLDAAGRPLMLPGEGEYTEAEAADAELTPMGPFVGLPTYLDTTLPTTYGAGSNEDTVLALRPADFLLFESVPVTGVYSQPLSGSLQARIVSHRYAAFIGGLYPSSICQIAGTGLVGPSGGY